MVNVSVRLLFSIQTYYNLSVNKKITDGELTSLGVDSDETTVWRVDYIRKQTWTKSRRSTVDCRTTCCTCVREPSPFFSAATVASSCRAVWLSTLRPSTTPPRYFLLSRWNPSRLFRSERRQRWRHRWRRGLPLFRAAPRRHYSSPHYHRCCSPSGWIRRNWSRCPAAAAAPDCTSRTARHRRKPLPLPCRAVGAGVPTCTRNYQQT